MHQLTLHYESELIVYSLFHYITVLIVNHVNPMDGLHINIGWIDSMEWFNIDVYHCFGP